MKVQHFILTLCLLVQYSLFSQFLPANKYKSNLNATTVRYQIAKFHSSFQLEFGLHYSNFQNTRFFEISNEKWIKPQTGYQFRLNVLVQPLTIYGQYFSSNFDMSDYPGWRFPNDTKLRHSGLALGLSTQLLPFTKISKYINPTAGIAYRRADICANCSDSEEKEIHIVKPTSEFVWTFATQFHFSRFLYLSAEYNQSFLSSEFKNSTLSISLGFKYNTTFQ